MNSISPRSNHNLQKGHMKRSARLFLALATALTLTACGDISRPANSADKESSAALTKQANAMSRLATAMERIAAAMEANKGKDK